MSMQADQRHDVAEAVSTLRVVEVDARNDPRWEALVSTLSNGLIYHHPSWLQVLEEALGYKPVNLACEDANGQFRGVLPLFYKQGLFTGRQYSSLPRTPVGGPLARDSQSMAILVRDGQSIRRPSSAYRFTRRRQNKSFGPGTGFTWRRCAGSRCRRDLTTSLSLPGNACTRVV